MKRCKECNSEIDDSVSVCPFCSERIEGKQCPDCLSIVKNEAKVCKWCSHKFEDTNKQKFEISSFNVKADKLGTILNLYRLQCQSIHFSSEKIVTTTPGFFNLSRAHEEIPWSKIAGFSYLSGMFWDTVLIETRGQTSASITCLKKEDGEKIKNTLQKYENTKAPN